ncbi:hypothetical protein BaRGS_00028306, partial [Batillaria attramentaria]
WQQPKLELNGGPESDHSRTAVNPNLFLSPSAQCLPSPATKTCLGPDNTTTERWFHIHQSEPSALATNQNRFSVLKGGHSSLRLKALYSKTPNLISVAFRGQSSTVSEIPTSQTAHKAKPSSGKGSVRTEKCCYHARKERYETETSSVSFTNALRGGDWFVQ